MTASNTPAAKTAAANGLFTDEARIKRCSWCQATPLYRNYHDSE